MWAVIVEGQRRTAAHDPTSIRLWSWSNDTEDLRVVRDHGLPQALVDVGIPEVYTTPGRVKHARITTEQRPGGERRAKDVKVIALVGNPFR